MRVYAIEFCRIYTAILEEIDWLIMPDYYPALRAMYMSDPRDLITPGHEFPNRDAVYGFIFRMLLKKHAELKKEAVSANIQ
jgi:hypothetical protein